MSDTVKKLNLALAHLGESQVETADLDGMSGSGRKVHAHLEAGERFVVSRGPWLDAMVYATLQPLADTGGDWKYTHHFGLPADLLRVCVVGQPGGCEVMWERGAVLTDGGAERVVIRANHSGPLPVAYTRLVGWSGMGVALQNAIGLEVAARACMSVKGDQALADKLRKAANDAVVLAFGEDVVQQGGQLSVVGPGSLAAARASTV